jgi:hypothetical protein
MKMIRILSVAALAAFVFTACDKDDDNNDDNNNGNATAFTVRMTDAPGNYSALNVSITKVEAYLEGTGWVTLNSNTQNTDVLTLTNGTEMVLANKLSAQTGHYTRLRLTMGENNTVTVHDNTGFNTHDLGWTGSSDNTVEVNIDRNVSNGSTTSVLLDFDVAGSVSENILGNYSLMPDITWIENETTGVKGTITGAERGVLTFVSGANTYTTYLAQDGRFMIRGMANGIYDMTLSGMHDGATDIDEMEMQDIVVANGQITNMGSIAFN